MGAIARFEQAFLALREQRPLSRSLVFTEASLMLGAGTSVAPMRRDGEGVETLDLSGEDRILALLTVAFSAPVNAAVLVKLRRASELWAQGDKSLAQIHLEHLRLPKLENGEQAFRLFLADQLIASGHSPRGLCKVLGFKLPKGLRKFSPDQARDDHGRWTSGGAGGDAGSAEGSSARGASSRSHTYANGSAGANNNIILVSVEDPQKERDKDGPLYEERRDLGEETPEEDERHGRPINPMGSTPFPVPGPRPATAQSSAPKPSDFVGQDFGKLGVGIEKPELGINLLSNHAVRRTEERSLSSSDLEDTVANPLMVLRQSSGNFFYLSDSAAVVLDRSGKVVTTYSSADFDENVRAIIKHIHERE